MGKKGVESMIEEIKVYIENCKPMPLSQTKISVQKPELLSMLDELELKLPGEIERCKKIMRNKEMILADARTRSDAIITESVNEANRMIEQNEITRLANIRADEILENARNQAQQIVDQLLRKQMRSVWVQCIIQRTSLQKCVISSRRFMTWRRKITVF